MNKQKIRSASAHLAGVSFLYNELEEMADTPEMEHRLEAIAMIGEQLIQALVASSGDVVDLHAIMSSDKDELPEEASRVHSADQLDCAVENQSLNRSVEEIVMGISDENPGNPLDKGGSWVEVGGGTRLWQPDLLKRAD